MCTELILVTDPHQEDEAREGPNGAAREGNAAAWPRRGKLKVATDGRGPPRLITLVGTVDARADDVVADVCVQHNEQTAEKPGTLPIP